MSRELTNKELTRLEKALTEQYRASEKRVQKKIQKHVDTFSQSQYKKLQQVAKGDVTPEEYEEWLDKELNYSDWADKAVKDGAKEQTKVNQIAMGLIAASLAYVLRENISYGTYEAERATGIDTSYSMKDLIKIIKSNPLLLPKRKLDIPKDRRWNERMLKRAFIDGYKKGERGATLARRLQKAGMVTFRVEDIKDRHLKTSKQIARELSKKNRNAAIRNARTMTTSVENHAKFESYRRAERLGLKIVKGWSATMDDRTRDSHAFLDGVTVKIEEEFPNGLMYPGDLGGSADEVWNCRCELFVEQEGYERDMSDLSQRNTDNFNYGSYEEWKESHSLPKWL